jgi:hypothetical protein
MSLITDDPLLLMIEALSKAPRGGACIDIEAGFEPEMDDAPDLRPWKWSLDRELETGRRSGKSAFTMVIRSEGPRTRYGCTSTVSLKDVMDLAGSSFAVERDGRLERKRDMMFSMCPLIASGVEADLFLCILSSWLRDGSNLVPCHINYNPLRSHRNLL